MSSSDFYWSHLEQNQPVLVVFPDLGVDAVVHGLEEGAVRHPGHLHAGQNTEHRTEQTSRVGSSYTSPHHGSFIISYLGNIKIFYTRSRQSSAVHPRTCWLLLKVSASFPQNWANLSSRPR